MRKNDYFVLAIVGLALVPFFVFPSVYHAYEAFNSAHGMIMSFFKFAILATFGEVLGLRIRTGNYYQPGFGVIPRAFVWGVLGLSISMAFIIFNQGTLAFLKYMGVADAAVVLSGSMSTGKVLIAFCISSALNLIFAPVMMTLHKVTDTHITNNGGTLKGFFRPIQVGSIMGSLNWKVQWNFVFKRTIPLFWIPAHTVTFLLPPDFRVLFAALLGIVLGVLLSIAAQRGEGK